jgi:hypothetical protein
MRIKIENVVGVFFGSDAVARIVRDDGDVGVRSGKVGEYTISGDPESRNGSVELGDHVRRSHGLANYYHRASVTGFCLPVKRLFDSRIPDEDKRSRLKVEVDNARVMFLLEPSNVSFAEPGNDFLHLLEILGTLRQLAGSNRDEFLGGDAGVLLGCEVCSFENVKRKERVNTVS